MIKYLGSKRTLLDSILNAAGDLDGGTVIDLFSGTGRVGHRFKREGYHVIANDLNVYAATLAGCYVQADRESVGRAEGLIRLLNGLPGKSGYFTKTFCEDAMFFQPRNGRRVDAIRDWIEANDLDPDLRAVLLTSLMEAADRVDNTCGIQMAYLKDWAKRSFKDMELRMPDVLPSVGKRCEAHQLDAVEASKQLSGNIGYLDPPYNQHKYLGNYHVWETLVRWDSPEAYGVARKRVDCKTRKSPFNSKPGILPALRQVVANLDVKHLMLSFNDEGYVSHDDLMELMSSRGEVRVYETAYDRYIGAKIGIHNPEGNSVGEVSHIKNKERLYVVST